VVVEPVVVINLLVQAEEAAVAPELI